MYLRREGCTLGGGHAGHSTHSGMVEEEHAGHSTHPGMVGVYPGIYATLGMVGVYTLVYMPPCTSLGIPPYRPVPAAEYTPPSWVVRANLLGSTRECPMGGSLCASQDSQRCDSW